MATLIISEQDSSLNALIEALSASLDATSCTIYTGRPVDKNYVGTSQIYENYDSTIQILPPEEMYQFPGKKNIALVKSKLANDDKHFLKKFDLVLPIERPLDSAIYTKTEQLFNHKNERLRLYYEEDDNAYEVLKAYYSEFVRDESVILYYIGDNYDDHGKYVKKILDKDNYPHTMVFNNALYHNKVSILQNANATLTENEEAIFYSKPYIWYNQMRNAWLSLKDFENNREFVKNPDCNEMIKRIKCALET
jgi:hypothetical protein